MPKQTHVRVTFYENEPLTTDFQLIQQHTGIKNGSDVVRYLITEKARELKS